MKKKSLISLTMLVLLSSTAHATTVNDGLAKCAKIQDSLVRLVCFDDLAQQVTTTDTVADTSSVAASIPSESVPVAKSDIATVPVTTPAKPVANKVDDFGAEHLKKSQVIEKDEQQIVFTIAKLKQDPYGKLRFTFENGQHWKQTDSNRLKVKTGESVVLEKGFMGGIFLKKNNGNRKIRVKRLK
ncbi:MAG: hypothetical protein ACPG52_05435 [Cognaticolwellia sp.]